MIGFIVERALQRAEKRFGVSFDYAREMHRISPRATWQMLKLQKIGGYREACPPAAWHAAHIAAALTEDCGPCVQMAVTLAREDGVAAETLRALIDRRLDAIETGTADAFLFGEAVARSAATADDLRARLQARYGEKAIVDLAIGIAIARVWPALKRAMGHAQFCQRVVIDGVSAPVLRAAD